ncbi:tricarballylate utilization 4Fe-4S protein TcuB [Salinisphaera aquimarina]|uniref:Tricarballylate utilization 4Fe-4S protein TcuB n=1 Tax=Salinisphaera aquimarina TaxID=2094031 RepID=A0ABV7EII0_9GAMM
MSTLNLATLASGTQEEAARQMTVCNACRYCEGLCAVFPAMELRRDFAGGDVDYLANLCHNCGACFYGCQYVPPHEFAINVPVAMAELREETYARYAWPRMFARVFERNGLWIGLIAAVSVAAFIIGLILLSSPAALFDVHTGPGAFYRLLPHNAMALLFGAAFVYAIVAMSMSVRRFWQASEPIDRLAAGSIWQATRDAVTLRYLDGGGRGCMNDGERPRDKRRLLHHFTSGGFMLCFASTSSGTLFHYFGWEAPYPVWHPTVVLGIFGGLGLLIGPIGLLVERRRRDRDITQGKPFDMGHTFIWMLLLTSVTGLLLLAFRSTAAMGLLLAIHLGVVFALFVTLPYGKFVHAIYRVAALIRHAHEQRAARSD